MSKDKLTDYDATASGNLDVGGVSVAEGMLPSGVNNAIREQMSHQKEAFGLGTPLYVDQTNNRLGVGTTSPTRNISISDTVPYINLVGSTTSAIGMLLGDTDAEIRGALLYDNNADRINLRAGGNTTRVSIDSDGLKFGSDTAAANALDDYEFGTWNPSVGGTATYGPTNYGRYVKVGNIVMAQFNLAINVLGTGSTASITGLPYTSENIGWVQTGSVSYFANLATATNFIGVYINSSSTQINFVGNTGSVTTVTHNGFGLIGNSTQIACGLTYRAA